MRAWRGGADRIRARLGCSGYGSTPESLKKLPPHIFSGFDCSWYQTLAMFSVVKGVESDVLINNNGCKGLFLFKFEGAVSFLTRTA